MKIKLNMNAAEVRKLQQESTAKLERASRAVQSKSAGKSPSEVAAIARSEFERIGVQLNEEGVQRFVDAAHPKS